MKPICRLFFTASVFCFFSFAKNAGAQHKNPATQHKNAGPLQLWGSWAHKIPTNGYEGKRFRVEARIRAEGYFEESAARLWARVDHPRKDGFFENMGETPVQDMEWKTYSIEGIIDPGATQLVVGPLLTSAGRFYFDNLKVEIETKKDKWKTVFAEDFEKDLRKWEAGIGKGMSGISDSYNASLVTDKSSKSRVLFIEGTQCLFRKLC